MKRNKDVAAALALQPFDQVAAEKPGAAGDHDALVREAESRVPPLGGDGIAKGFGCRL